jgi:hypothetical protein
MLDQLHKRIRYLRISLNFNEVLKTTTRPFGIRNKSKGNPRLPDPAL